MSTGVYGTLSDRDDYTRGRDDVTKFVKHLVK